MTPENVYEKYLAIKLHFSTENYDYFKYHGKTSASARSWDKRSDKLQFNKIAKNYTSNEIEGLFVSNFVGGDTNAWPGHYSSPEAKETYLRWLKGIQSLNYVLKEESTRAKEFMDDDNLEFNKLMAVEEGQHPLLLRYFYAQEISLETLMIYASIFKFLPRWNKEINDNIVWPETYLLISKYRGFLELDQDKLKKVIQKVWK